MHNISCECYFTGLLQERDLESGGRMQVAAHHLECDIWGQRQSSLCAPCVLNVYQPLVSNEVRDKSCEREREEKKDLSGRPRDTEVSSTISPLRNTSTEQRGWLIKKNTRNIN